jgi:Bifunctional DNA primase/polymerase, N-terminal
VATTRFDHARLPDPVAHFEKTFGRLRFNIAGWAQVNCCFHGPDREPSLSLHRAGGFNCFACGAHGGDIIEFEHLRTGRDRRAIAQDWGAWSGSPIYERPRPAWVRPAPRPVIVKERADKPKLTVEFFEAARLNFEAVKAEAHRLCDRGFSVHPLDGKFPRGNGWQNAPRKTHDDIEHRCRPRLFNGVISYPNLGFRIDMEPAGDAPNCVTDVDIRTNDPAEIAACMAAVRRLMGARQPDAVTGRDGLHFYDQLPRMQLGRIFGFNEDERLLKNVHKLDWPGRDEGVVYDNTMPWTVELFGPKHNVVAPPSIHPFDPATLPERA